MVTSLLVGNAQSQMSQLLQHLLARLKYTYLIMVQDLRVPNAPRIRQSMRHGNPTASSAAGSLSLAGRSFRHSLLRPRRCQEFHLDGSLTVRSRPTVLCSYGEAAKEADLQRKFHCSGQPTVMSTKEHDSVEIHKDATLARLEEASTDLELCKLSGDIGRCVARRQS